MTAIKDSLQFRGPPDPVRGDEPYERVRTAAKESLDAVYSDTPQDNGGGTPFATSASASYGPSPDQQSFGGGGGGPSGSGGIRRMDGIGNPMFSDPRMEPQTRGIGNMTVKDVVSEARETVIGMMKDPLARNGGMNVGDNHSGSMPRPGGSYGGPGGVSYENNFLLGLCYFYFAHINNPIVISVFRAPAGKKRVDASNRWPVDHGLQPWSICGCSASKLQQ